VLPEAIDQAEASEPDETAERIVVGALREFEEFGLRRTSMEDVARRAGLSRVTVYRRFAGKEALLEAVLFDQTQRFFEELDAAVSDCETTDEVLAEGFAFALHRLRVHPLLNRLLETEPELILPRLTVESGWMVQSVRGLIVARLGARLEGTGLGPRDVEVTAEVLLRLVHSFLLMPITAAPVETLEQARGFAFRYLTPALHSVVEAS
jgi:AcrR family transcriptional regulator